MGLFECCHKCPSAKRHLGCHDTCEEYKEQVKLNEQLKEARHKESLVYHPRTDFLNRPVWKMKKR
jgi:hypothetical protein